MTKQCAVAACGQQAVGYSHHCAAHRARTRRHGHPQQNTITVAQVRPYVALMRRWVDAQSNGSALWAAFDNAVVALVETAEPHARTTHRKGECLAIEYLLKTHADAGPRKIAETVAALTIMRIREPCAFRDDRAFRVAVGRHVRKLTDRSSGCYWRESEKRVIKVYRDGKSIAVERLGGLLSDSLARIGLEIEKREAVERDRRDLGKATAAVMEAFAAVE